MQQAQAEVAWQREVLGLSFTSVCPPVGTGPRGTFVSSGRLPEAAGDEVAAQPQRLVGAPVDVLYQHVHVGVLALGSQV